MNLLSAFLLILAITAGSGLLFELIILNQRAAKKGISEKQQQRIVLWGAVTGLFVAMFWYLNH